MLSRNGASPLTRTPLRLQDLRTNRSLGDAIQEFVEADPARQRMPSPSTIVDTDAMALPPLPPLLDDALPQLTLTASTVAPTDRLCGGVLQEGEEEVLVHATISPSTGGGIYTPSHLICVIDTSGSMCSEASMKSASGESESHGLSMLDLVKHACRTVVNTLGPNDLLSLVTFSSTAQVRLRPARMDISGRALAEAQLDAMAPGGQTNLWDGLREGLDLATESTAEAADGFHRLSHLVLLTDGLPNIAPPRGERAMLGRYADSAPGGALPASISTFGFGYNLDSALLADLADQGDGSYAFIPDSGLVGTVFVHTLANLVATAATGARLALEPEFGVRLLPALPGGSAALFGPLPCDKTSWGATSRIGQLRFGQSKDLITRLAVPKAKLASNAPLLNVTLICAPRALGRFTKTVAELRAASVVDTVPLTTRQHTHRLRFVDTLDRCIALGGSNDDARLALADFTTSLRADVALALAGDPAATALLADAAGQCVEALQAESFSRWGRHFLPSLARAHALQACNNFKDPGVQLYGGALFSSARDAADDIFCKLPPPRPSRGGGARGGKGGRGGGGHSASTPISMASYHNSGGGCWIGACAVTLADGTTKRTDEIKAGDVVAVPSESGGPDGAAVVECVVVSRCADGAMDLIALPGGGPVITPWHPVRWATAGSTREGAKWAFPEDVIGAVRRRGQPCGAVYSLLLAGGATSARIDGIPAISLGHGIIGDTVATHPFLGDRRAINGALGTLPGFERGRVILAPYAWARDPDTNCIAGIFPQLALPSGAEDVGAVAAAAPQSLKAPALLCGMTATAVMVGVVV